MIVSATRSDAPTVTSTAVGSTRMNWPDVPPIIISGRKANMIVAVQPTIASKICRVARIAACMRECPSRRKRAMFSTTTIESSTSRPSATTKPGDRDLVEREAEEIQRRQADRERQRNRDHHDARGAQPERQQRDGDQRDRDPEVGRQPVEAVRDVLRLIEAELQLDALRQLRLEALRRGDECAP